jgi:hypothetical protein
MIADDSAVRDEPDMKNMVGFVTNRLENTRSESAGLENKRSQTPAPRRLACSRCGTAFTCNVAGPCWCAEETAMLPMPVDGEDCVCRDCLRKTAAEHAASHPAAAS